MDELKAELKQDIAWSNVNLEPFIKNVEKRGNLRKNHTLIARTFRCISRRMKRIEAKNTLTIDISYTRDNRPNLHIKESDPDFFRLCEILYFIQFEQNDEHRGDFEASICCPSLFDSRTSFYERLKKEIKFKDKHIERTNMILHNRLYNPHIIIEGMCLAKNTQGYIKPTVAADLIGYIDTIYETNRCNMCVYSILALLVYEYEPLSFFRDKLITIGMSFKNNSALFDINVAPYKLFIDTYDDRFLHIFTLIVGKHSSWYKDFVTKFKTCAKNAITNPRVYFSIYCSDPTTLNHSMSLKAPTDIEKAYIEIGKEFYCKEHDKMIPSIINNKHMSEINIIQFHYSLMDERFPNALFGLVLAAHTAVFKYLLSKN